MIYIQIISITENGEKALKKHMEECAKLPRHKKLTAKMLGISQSVISTNPYTILLTQKKLSFMIVKKKDIIRPIREALKHNGALDNDYSINIEG